MAFQPRVFRFLGFGMVALALTSCTQQYDPSTNNSRLRKEAEVAHTPQPKLTENGELPQAGGPVVSVDERYATLCASCHGAQGGGDGPGGGALNPKPRDFHDAAWQASATDERIFQVIKSGGASVGLSPLMAPWGSILSDDEIKNMVAKVRSFKK